MLALTLPKADGSRSRLVSLFVRLFLFVCLYPCLSVPISPSPSLSSSSATTAPLSAPCPLPFGLYVHTPNPIYLPTLPECVGVCGTYTAFIMQLQTHLHCFLHDFMLYFLFEEQRTCCVFHHDKSAPHIESFPNICLLSHFYVLFVAPLMFYPITPSCRNSHNNQPIMWLPARHIGHNRRLTPRACRQRVIETSEVLIGKEPRSRLVLQYEGM